MNYANRITSLRKPQILVDTLVQKWMFLIEEIVDKGTILTGKHLMVIMTWIFRLRRLIEIPLEKIRMKLEIMSVRLNWLPPLHE